MTQQFKQRLCHGDVLCSLPEDMEEPPHISGQRRTQCRCRLDASTTACQGSKLAACQGFQRWSSKTVLLCQHCCQDC